MPCLSVSFDAGLHTDSAAKVHDRPINLLLVIVNSRYLTSAQVQVQVQVLGVVRFTASVIGTFASAASADVDVIVTIPARPIHDPTINIAPNPRT